MAKFAVVGYGSRGQGVQKDGEGYTYIVNDNVRVGQRLQVISTARDHVTKFPTTGVPLKTYHENSVAGQVEKAQLGDKANNLTKAYTGGELGASGEITQKDITIGKNKPQSEYTITSRAKAMEKYLQNNPTATISENAEDTMAYAKENKPVKGSKGGTFADYTTNVRTSNMVSAEPTQTSKYEDYDTYTSKWRK